MRKKIIEDDEIGIEELKDNIKRKKWEEKIKKCRKEIGNRSKGKIGRRLYEKDRNVFRKEMMKKIEVIDGDIEKEDIVVKIKKLGNLVKIVFGVDKKDCGKGWEIGILSEYVRRREILIEMKKKEMVEEMRMEWIIRINMVEEIRS